MKKTIVYIDGFNLYYGLLHNKPHRWLDLKKMCEKLLADYNDIVSIKYFTAKTYTKDKNKSGRQNLYWKALKAYIPEIDIIEGTIKPKKCKYRNKRNKRETLSHTVLVEKQTDVNIAVHMLNDAWNDTYDVAVLISNDSDLKESLRLIKIEKTDKSIVLLAPVSNKGVVVQELAQLADSVSRIDYKTLKESQLPDSIPNTKISKPREW